MNSIKIIIGLFLGITIISLQAQSLPTPYFIPDKNENSETGYIQLKWIAQSDEDETILYQYQLQQAEDSTFSSGKEIYRGNDLASFISGLSNGNYYYRVRVIDEDRKENGPWSATKLVAVKHHSLELALSLFTLGGIVFLSTVLIVVRGSRKIGNDN
ncbi:MAG: hypothetical protein KDC80_03710 [Saprospiraceae bacterium]|nr:hypothetical protein [Saprospiraceae bacterium]